MKLDRTDFEILRVLQDDARSSNKVIAAAVGLAPSTVHERVRRLRAEGVITGSTLDHDLAVFGVGLQALFMVTLSKHDRGLVDRFMDEVSRINEVRSLFLISGRYDVVAHVLVRDVPHLRDLALDRFTSREGVEQIETSLIYESRTNRVLTPMLPPGEPEAP